MIHSGNHKAHSFGKTKKIKLSLIFVCLFALILPEHPSFGQVNWIGERVNIQKSHFTIAEEKQPPHSITQITSLPFETPKTRILNPDRNKCYWVKIDITSNRDELVIFQSDNSYLSIVEFHPSDQSYNTSKKAGLAFPSSIREFPYPTPTFSYQMKKGINTVYFRLKSRSPEEFNFYLEKPSQIHLFQAENNLLAGLCYGTIVIIAIYSLFLLFILKDKSYAFYVLYALASLFFLLSKDQFGNIYIWGDWVWFNFNSGPIAHILLTSSFVAYGILLIRDNSVNHWERPLLIGLASYIFIGSILWFGFSIRFVLESLNHLFFIFLLYQGWLKYRKGHFHALLFFIGYLYLPLTLTFHKLLEFHLIPQSLFKFSEYAYNVGVVIEMILMLLSLVIKRRESARLIKEKDDLYIHELEVNEKLKTKVNRELEEQVRLRIAELNLKSDELVKANRKLEEFSSKMANMASNLDKDNFKLKKSLTESKTKRLQHEHLNKEEFEELYPDDETCKVHLAELKWADQYTCSSCAHQHHLPVKNHLERTCGDCRKTAKSVDDTIFKVTRFSLTKAFAAVHLFLVSDGEISSYEVERQIGLRQKTAWSFLKRLSDKKRLLYKGSKSNKKLGWQELILD